MFASLCLGRSVYPQPECSLKAVQQQGLHALVHICIRLDEPQFPGIISMQHALTPGKMNLERRGTAQRCLVIMPIASHRKKSRPRTESQASSCAAAYEHGTACVSSCLGQMEFAAVEHVSAAF